MADTTQAFESFEQKWLAAFPENRVIAVFLPVDKRRRAQAFGTLVHEITLTTFHSREPQAAAAKLAWWRQELADAGAGSSRHPITRVLFADDVAQTQIRWPLLAEAALVLIEQPPAASIPELLAQLNPFHSAIARAEAGLFGNTIADARAGATLWTISHLLRELSREQDDRLPVPLDLLARHGVRRTDLAALGSRRAALMREYLENLHAVLNKHADVSALPLQRRVRARLDRSLIARAIAAADPLEYLRRYPHAGNWRSLWTSWREARAGARKTGN